jgi:hypothetical protein
MIDVFELALSLPGTTEISYGGSKLFQILIPLFAFMALQEIPGLRGVTRRIIQLLRPQQDPKDYDYLVNMLLGFFSWKVGCDLGFLLVATSAAPWSIAFTVAGLIPYTLTQYFLYYLVGHKMILQGNINPLKEEFVVKKISSRPSIWKQFISKFFHENMNVTSANIPLRQVVLKPFVDYGGLITSWPLYNVGLLFFQSGEINFAPMVHFMFLKIFVFYVVNVMGYILGYNLGEFLYFQLIYGSEWVKRKLRTLISPSSSSGQGLWLVGNDGQLAPLAVLSSSLQSQSFRAFLARYGLNIRWFVSAGMGVLFVVLLEPSLAGSIFSAADRVQHTLFYTFGHLDTDHVQQFLTASSPIVPADPQGLIDGFPTMLNRLYATTSFNAPQNLQQNIQQIGMSF